MFYMLLMFINININSVLWGLYLLGKRCPKPSFVDVACPNKDCEDYGKIENENVVGNGTYQSIVMTK